MFPGIALRAVQEGLFLTHRWQHNMVPREKGVIYLPDPYKRGIDRDVLSGLLKRIAHEFRKGNDSVVIDVGNRGLQESMNLCFGRKTFGTHAINFLSSDSVLDELSKQAGKSIEIYEGLKKFDSSKIDLQEVGSEYLGGKDDKSYIVIKIARE